MPLDADTVTVRVTVQWDDKLLPVTLDAEHNWSTNVVTITTEGEYAGRTFNKHKFGGWHEVGGRGHVVNMTTGLDA